MIFRIIALCLFTHTFYIFSQESTNYSVANAELICGQKSSIEKSFSDSIGFHCLNNKTKLYYTFIPIQDYVLGSSINIKYSISASVSSSYKIYGPFNLGMDYDGLIATNSAPILTTVTGISTYPVILNGTILKNKRYILEIEVNQCSGSILLENQTADFPCSDDIACENCLPKFQPIDGKYIVSAWVKEANNPSATTYTNGYLRVTSGSNTYNLYGKGQIIDGWQRIEGEVITNNLGEIKVDLLSTNGTVYFDDLRIFPTDGSMISYVYDPITLNLVAELDERNYAKLYEYDEEGKLIRVKKETEKGIMTIQENRENTHGN